MDENGKGYYMEIQYDDKRDLLYFRLDESKQDIINKRVTDNVVLDIGKDNRIVGIEILEASRHVSLESLLPVKYGMLNTTR